MKQKLFITKYLFLSLIGLLLVTNAVAEEVATSKAPSLKTLCSLYPKTFDTVAVALYVPAALIVGSGLEKYNSISVQYAGVNGAMSSLATGQLSYALGFNNFSACTPLQGLSKMMITSKSARKNVTTTTVVFKQTNEPCVLVGADSTMYNEVTAHNINVSFTTISGKESSPLTLIRDVKVCTARPDNLQMKFGSIISGFLLPISFGSILPNGGIASYTKVYIPVNT